MGTIPLAPLLIAALGLADPGPAELVGRLGSPRFAEREAAAERLEALGPAAVPALLRALESSDQEVRARALDLLDRIERAEILRPTTVRLHFRGRPLGEVLGGLEAQSGIPLMLNPQGPPPDLDRRVTLESDGPVPAWEALVRFSRAAGLRFDPTPISPPGRGIVHGVLLGPAGATLAPTSVHGPFCTRLLGFARNEVLNFEPPPGELALFRELTLSLQIASEPALAIRSAGPARWVEAKDDLGRSWLPASREAPGDHSPSDDPRFGDSTATATLPLHPPDEPGQSLSILRGLIPLEVARRRPEPMVIHLADAAGKSFLGEEVVVTVRAIQAEPDLNRTSLEIGLRPRAEREPGSAPPAAPEPPGDGPSPLERLADSLDRRFQVIDAQGRELGQFLRGSQPSRVEVRLRLTLVPGEGVGPPEVLRFYDLIRTGTEVPFEFRDVPLP